MRATRNGPGNASDGDESHDEDQFPLTPDEQGPHDVPDDKVIEKTLPTRPTPGSGGKKG
jgi:hypothetical protein